MTRNSIFDDIKGVDFLKLVPQVPQFIPSPLSIIASIFEYSNSNNAKLGVLCKMMKIGSKNKPLNKSIYKKLFLDKKSAYNIYINKK